MYGGGEPEMQKLDEYSPSVLENQPTRVPYKQGFCAQLHIRLIAQGNLEEVRRPIVCDGGMLDGIFQV